MTAQDLLAVREYITVAHHVPGRVRLKFNPAIRSHPAFAAVKNGPDIMPGIKTSRVNIAARSLVIEYDTSILSHQTVQELFTTMDADRTAALLDDWRRKTAEKI